MKKILCLILCFMLMSMTAFAATFTDVAQTDYFATAASELSDKGILTGYPDGTFGPEKTIIRAEITTVIVRMLGKDADAKVLGGKTNFNDVDATKWYSGYVTLASNEGIVNGVGNGLFAPETPVTFEQAVTMVIRAVGLEGEVVKYADDWSKGYLDLAEEKGILNGLAGSKGMNATRGDVAVMVYNGLNMESQNTPVVDSTVTTPIEVPTEDGVEETYTVTFIEDAENESIFLIETVKVGETVGMPADPMMDEYEFTGWFTDMEGTNTFSFLTPITEDITLYAGWDEIEEEEPIYDEEGNIIEDYENEDEFYDDGTDE